MCHSSCIEFGKSHISREEIKGKTVLEAGSLNVNGSLRGLVCDLDPMSYTGVDMVSGEGVDEICDVNDLVKRYGSQNFDVVICTEVLEHVRDWRRAISNLKNVLKSDGIMILSTRSKAFPYHGFPFDFWRFEADDIHEIFDDMIIETNERDREIPGVFAKVRRPAVFAEKNLDYMELYSVIKGGRCRDIDDFNLLWFKAKYAARRMLSRVLPGRARAFLRENISTDRSKS